MATTRGHDHPRLTRRYDAAAALVAITLAYVAVVAVLIVLAVS